MDALSRGHVDFLGVFVPGSYASAEVVEMLAMESTNISWNNACISIVNLWSDLADHLFIRVSCKRIERVPLRVNGPVGVCEDKNERKTILTLKQSIVLDLDWLNHCPEGQICHFSHHSCSPLPK